VWQGLFHHAHAAEDVGVDGRFGLRDGAFVGRAHRADAGVVDQDVDPPEPLDHLPDRGRDGAPYVQGG
jgi:hypothetical protein